MLERIGLRFGHFLCGTFSGEHLLFIPLMCYQLITANRCEVNEIRAYRSVEEAESSIQAVKKQIDDLEKRLEDKKLLERLPAWRRPY